jgi:hypothetical protein
VKGATVPAGFNTTQFHDFLLDHRVPVADMYDGSEHFPSVDGAELTRLWERGQRLWMPMSHFGASGLDEHGNKHGVLGYNESFLQRWCDEANRTIGRALDAGFKMDNLLMYAYDEPGLSQMPGLEQLSRTIKKNFPRIKLATCGTNQWRYFLGAGNASVGDGTGNGTISIPVSDGRLKDVDLIIPRAWEYSANWSDPTVKLQIDRARSKGKRIGWYVSGVPVGMAGLNWYTESPPLAARLMAGVAAVKQESDALLYYSLNDWSAYVGTAGVQNISDTLEILDFRFDDRSSGDGEGMILVPSPSGTLSTVSFENIRDGLEDLEWYSYLDRLVVQARAAGLNVDAEAKLRLVPDELFDHVQFNRGPSNFTYSRDPSVLRRQRSMVAEAIAEILKKMDTQDANAHHFERPTDTVELLDHSSIKSDDEETFSGVSSPPKSDSNSCQSDLDCSLNGVCGNATCDCDSGWSGVRCHLLDFAPSEHHTAYDVDGNTSSWGGSAALDPADGKWHGFFSEFAGHCGVNSWLTNSMIVHAVSEQPQGPYIRQDVALGAWAHGKQLWCPLCLPNCMTLMLCCACRSGGAPRPEFR